MPEMGVVEPARDRDEPDTDCALVRAEHDHRRSTQHHAGARGHVSGEIGDLVLREHVQQRKRDERCDHRPRLPHAEHRADRGRQRGEADAIRGDPRLPLLVHERSP